MQILRDWRYIASGFILIPIVIMLVKILGYDYSFNTIIPDKGYKLTLTIETNNLRPDSINIKTFAPLNNTKHSIIREQGISDTYMFSLTNEDENRRIVWQSHKVSGENKMEYISYLKSRHIKYIFNEKTILNDFIPENVKVHLNGTVDIQKNSPYIKAKLDEITAGKNTVYDKILAIHKYIIHDIKYVNFSGILDAETCLMLGEGSCNGKSRLYVAMIQNLGLPARVVGGIILNSSPKKMIHQWVEIYMNGQWVPFCPTNDHFAELPKNYIALYFGDEVLFKRTAGIDFNYYYTFEKITLLGEDVNNKFQNLPFNIYRFVNEFEKFKLSMDVFIYLLMLPFAALISVILKNVIGLETFGTFLPILIASVLHNTGVITGISVFFGIIFLVYFTNILVSRLDLLYHPKMAILLSFVILALLIIFNMGLEFQYYNLVYVVFFPVAIIAITINRVITLIDEASFKRLLIVSINTTIVTVIAFYFIHSIFLQLVMLSFPEIILILIGLNIVVGRWAGFRVIEYFRFAGLIKDRV
jgi:transglutaminase-like putative cysteine protease